MLDTTRLTELSEALERSVREKDVENIQRLCDENDEFIRSIQPVSDAQLKEQIKTFISIHRSAILFIKDVHSEMQKQLYQTNKSRKGVSQYKGVKNAK